jgi:hypothetical protein
VGIDKVPIIEDSEEYLNSKKNTPQLVIKIIPNKIFIENKIPT